MATLVCGGNTTDAESLAGSAATSGLLSEYTNEAATPTTVPTSTRAVTETTRRMITNWPWSPAKPVLRVVPIA